MLNCQTEKPTHQQLNFEQQLNFCKCANLVKLIKKAFHKKIRKLFLFLTIPIENDCCKMVYATQLQYNSQKQQKIVLFIYIHLHLNMSNVKKRTHYHKQHDDERFVPKWHCYDVKKAMNQTFYYLTPQSFNMQLFGIFFEFSAM